MKKISRSLLFAAGMMSTSLLAAEAGVPCSLIDLAGHEQVIYDPFIGLLKGAGFDPAYIGLHTFADDADLIERIATAQKGVFVAVAADLLANMGVSPVGKKLKQLLERVASVPNYFVGLFLPNFGGVKPNMALLPALHEIFAPLGIVKQGPLLQELERRGGTPISVRQLTSAAIDFFLKNPIVTRPMPFHTTLSMPHRGRPFVSRLLVSAHKNQQLSLTLLPANAKRHASKKIQPMLPFFLYTYSSMPAARTILQDATPAHKAATGFSGQAGLGLCVPPRITSGAGCEERSVSKEGGAQPGLHIIIGNEMLLSGLGITEQFHIRPLKTAYAKEMLELLGLSMAQFHALVTKAEPLKKNFHEVVRAAVKPTFKEVTDSFGRSSGDDDNRVLRKVAWMELNMFEPLSPDQAKKISILDQARRQSELINYLIKAKFDGLWVTLNPHQYWSPIARKKDREQAFLLSVRSFTKQLAAACKQANHPIPPLLVGFEITNNIYQPNLPKNCSVDMFGNEFNDIPAPLHEPFWREEVVVPLQELARRWQDPTLSHGVPLKGVVIDLEMYCRRRTGSFTPTCGFDKEALVAYDATLVEGTASTHSAVQKLMESGRCAAFLAARAERAKQLGMMMRNAFKKTLGDEAYVLCYAQNLMIDWFYKGLYQGLGTKEDPVGVLTFNAEFMRHRPWLEQQGIYMNHGCVVLLSKLASPKDFGYVNYVRQAHQSVWLNRVSRLVEDYDPKNWITVEQTPLSTQGKARLMRHLAAI